MRMVEKFRCNMKQIFKFNKINKKLSRAPDSNFAVNWETKEEIIQWRTSSKREREKNGIHCGRNIFFFKGKSAFNNNSNYLGRGI